jgi:hypothetical protein
MGTWVAAVPLGWGDRMTELHTKDRGPREGEKIDRGKKKKRRGGEVVRETGCDSVPDTLAIGNGIEFETLLIGNNPIA